MLTRGRRGGLKAAALGRHVVAVRAFAAWGVSSRLLAAGKKNCGVEGMEPRAAALGALRGFRVLLLGGRVCGCV